MAKPNRPDYFDQDEPDDQHGTIADAEKDAENSSPVLVSKSAFRGKSYEVGDMVSMRVQAIHDDEVELVCESKGSETTDESEETPEPVGDEGMGDEAEVVAPEGGGSPAAMFD